ncbi:extracellular solute-binding protein [Actinoplanes sp. L3-i22]|uniref:extracellular solute-binding protein n=1 Tax=Actinoplanes sp. L3-i22 TaxID=2836373 RepID=UPI001C75A3DA|nr:extracellular solute-binding protein [Actinoplanes sp. L3-i22]BCY09635.1 sugar ABC transporter substrate-binding protein [Actinoplanes sp. L3-i22]
MTRRFTVSRRGFTALVALSAIATTAACGSAGPQPTGTAGGGLTMWALSDQTTLKDSVDAYNADHPTAKITLQLFANDDYKQKLRVAFGAGQGPDIFFSWGGGALNDYVKTGKVAEITGADLDTGRFTPSVLKTATFGGKVYGIPANGLAPVVLYYNKKVLDAAGLRPPTTLDELTSAVTTLKGKGVTPISLAANSKWPTLMWHEYLLDRAGGSQVFDRIGAGDGSGWLDPSVTRANQQLQDLVGLGAFGANASSLSYDQGAATALLYTGKAAFELMGTWEYANIVKAAPEFVTSGDLGYTAFPATGGAGDPAAIVGNPSNYLSVNAATKQKAAALTYLKDYVLDDSQVDKYLAAGSVAPVNGLDAKLAAVPGADQAWLRFVYDLVRKAPNFQLSWDQALPSEQADPLLTNVDQSFLKKITPEQFGQNLSKVS